MQKMRVLHHAETGYSIYDYGQRRYIAASLTTDDIRSLYEQIGVHLGLKPKVPARGPNADPRDTLSPLRNEILNALPGSGGLTTIGTLARALPGANGQPRGRRTISRALKELEIRGLAASTTEGPGMIKYWTRTRK